MLNQTNNKETEKECVVVLNTERDKDPSSEDDVVIEEALEIPQTTLRPRQNLKAPLHYLDYAETYMTDTDKPVSYTDPITSDKVGEWKKAMIEVRLYIFNHLLHICGLKYRIYLSAKLKPNIMCIMFSGKQRLRSLELCNSNIFGDVVILKQNLPMIPQSELTPLPTLAATTFRNPKAEQLLAEEEKHKKEQRRASQLVDELLLEIYHRSKCMSCSGYTSTTSIKSQRSVTKYSSSDLKEKSVVELLTVRQRLEDHVIRTSCALNLLYLNRLKTLHPLKHKKRSKKKVSEPSEEPVEKLDSAEKVDVVLEARLDKLHSPNDSYKSLLTPFETSFVKIVEEGFPTPPKAESLESITTKIVTTVPVIESVVTREETVQISPEVSDIAKFIEPKGSGEYMVIVPSEQVY
ncbi:hypothetical protein RN001_012736 [Aquatica leii]|uniref:Uncharacterized protein n=1 Tax=Aquatica leii TaxID=1421715 RepID=A0AAN7SFB2_9COLE|nr:hypothetical protein RN001_012736 [Aquatica leii]